MTVIARCIYCNEHVKTLLSQKLILSRAVNTIPLQIGSVWPDAVYFAQIASAEEIINRRLLVRR